MLTPSVACAEAHINPNTHAFTGNVEHTHLLGIVNPLIVNEGKAAGASGPLVVNHIDPRQRAVAGEHLPKVALRGVQAQAKHPETCVRVRVRLFGGTEERLASLYSLLSTGWILGMHAH